jgi:hypothetical protein
MSCTGNAIQVGGLISHDVKDLLKLRTTRKPLTESHILNHRWF